MSEKLLNTVVDTIERLAEAPAKAPVLCVKMSFGVGLLVTWAAVAGGVPISTAALDGLALSVFALSMYAFMAILWAAWVGVDEFHEGYITARRDDVLDERV